MKAQTLKGFRDFLPEKMTVRNEVIKRLRGVFEKYGFCELQTPAVEYQDVLLGKYGQEAEKLMYLFTGPGGRNIGLKYDLTVPLARVVASYPDLPKPFKRYQIQPVWRAEKPQKGRYREIVQCDVDIVGSPSPLADAEIIAIINESCKTLGFPSFKIRINSRQVLFAIMEKAGINRQRWMTVIRSIDKLGKKTRQAVEQELAQKDTPDQQIKSVFAALTSAKPDDFLTQTISWAKRLGAAENLSFDPTLARGLDYYTGPIFETVVDKPQVGSITGGGRYDTLMGTIGGPDLPATGTTIGLDRAADVIEELNLWPDLPKTTTAVLVTTLSPNLLEKSVETANSLRKSGVNTELYLTSAGDKLNKQLKYANQKDIPYVVIIGPDEAEKGVVTLKNMRTGEQETVKTETLINKLQT